LYRQKTNKPIKDNRKTPPITENIITTIKVEDFLPLFLELPPLPEPVFADGLADGDFEDVELFTSFPIFGLPLVLTITLLVKAGTLPYR
jgi:hypothetical protein